MASHSLLHTLSSPSGTNNHITFKWLKTASYLNLMLWSDARSRSSWPCLCWVAAMWLAYEIFALISSWTDKECVSVTVSEEKMSQKRGKKQKCCIYFCTVVSVYAHHYLLFSFNNTSISAQFISSEIVPRCPLFSPWEFHSHYTNNVKYSANSKGDNSKQVLTEIKLHV